MACPQSLDYTSIFAWDRRELTQKQIDVLQRHGIDLALIRDRGHATVIISSLFNYLEHEAATEKQKRYCRFLGHPNPWQLTKREAGRWIAEHLLTRSELT